MENQYFDKQLRSVMEILAKDYAGPPKGALPVDYQYYTQAAGVAWKEGKLDQLLFLRYVSQMLATTGDRSLRLSVSGGGYEPFYPGFDARRLGESLWVTRVWQEERLGPGDEILRINSLSPGKQLSHFGKNFLYSDRAEREIWGGVLKMADHVLVRHTDGREEDLALRHYPGTRPKEESFLRPLGEGGVLLRLGSLGEEAESLIEGLPEELTGKDLLVIDLRHCEGDREEMLMPLVPYILVSAKSMDELAGEASYRTLYTRANCERRLEALEAYRGDPVAEEMRRELQERSGRGWVSESFRLWEDEKEPILPWPGRTAVLTDTWTEGAPEVFVLWAKQEGRALLAGRPTMGRLDFANEISVRISPTAVLTYPMSITEEAARGEGYQGRGIEPGIYVPFTARECREDAVLLRALEERNA